MGYMQNIRGKVMTPQCTAITRMYQCASAFPRCETDRGEYRPCRSLCLERCEFCMITSCPCEHLPQSGCLKTSDFKKDPFWDAKLLSSGDHDDKRRRRGS